MDRLTLRSLILVLLPALVVGYLPAVLGGQAQTFGIGVTFARVNGETWVDSITPGSPADRANLKVGDPIAFINDQSTMRMTEAEVAAAVRGAQGTTVRLIISDPGNKLHIVEVPRSIPVTGGNAAQPVQTQPRPVSAGPAPTPAAVQSAAGSAPTNVSFVKWVEPKERSFSVDVPAGWTVTGGLNWVGPLQASPFVRADSPDGKEQIFLGDANLTTLQDPPPGVREGTVYRTPIGDPVTYQRYLSGNGFAKYEVSTRHCKNPSWQGGGERQDLASVVAAAMQPEAARIRVTITASGGDVGFLCDTRQGYAVAVTMSSMAGNQRAWLVQSIGVFLSADPLRSMTTRYIMEHMQSTFALDPQWEAAYNQRVAQATGNVISMQNAQFQSQQAAARSASSTLSKMNHPNPGVTTRSSSTSSSSVNTTLGTRHVCDAIGRCQTISNDADTVFIDHSGRVAAGGPGGRPPDNSGVWSPMYPD